MVSREQSEPQPKYPKYLAQKFLGIVNFNFTRDYIYFFTIKPNHSVALYDNAKDMVHMINYLKKIMAKSSIHSVTYCFEVDSHKRLHIHGFAESTNLLRYKNLYREWGVHHNFSQVSLVYTHDDELQTIHSKIIYYIVKDPVGPIIKSFKEKDSFTDIRTLAFWYKEEE